MEQTTTNPKFTVADTFLAPYYAGVWCAPVLSLLLLGVAILFGMKYGYKLNKFTKQLKDHVADKGAHK